MLEGNKNKQFCPKNKNKKIWGGRPLSLRGIKNR
jgi:hypothetical protein